MPASSAGPRSFTHKVTQTLSAMVRRARSRKRRECLRRAWAVELLEGRRLLAVDFHQIATKVDSGVGGVKSSLEAIDSLAQLPLINKPIDQISQITTSLDKFQKNLRDAVDGLSSTSSERQVKDAIFGALNPIGVLQNRNGSGCADRSCINADDIDVVLSNSSVDIKLNLGYTNDDFSSDLGLGIDSVPFKPKAGTNGKFSVGVTYVGLNFGLDGTGAYFQRDAGQLQLKLEGFLPSDTFTVGLGFLTFQATDQNPGPDLTLTLTSTVTSTGISAPTIGGQLDLNMRLLVKVDSEGMPQLQTDFIFKWGIGSPSGPIDPRIPLGAAWGSPTLQFKDVQLSLGSLLGGVARPIARQVKEIIEPLKDVFDLLERPIPGINDISQEVGGPTVTLLALANTIPAVLPPQLLNMIRSADTLRGYYQKIDSLASLSGWLKLGDFNIADPSGNFLTGRAPSALGSIALDAAGKLLPVQLPWSNLISPSGTPNITGIKDQIRSLLGNAVGNEVVGIFEQLTKPAQENGLKFSFPIIDEPASVALGMLLGQDKDLVTVDGRLVFDFNKELKIKIIPGFNVLLSGAANFTAIANIGYDTRGLRQAMQPLYVGGSFAFGKLLDGLWIGSNTFIDATGSMRLGPQVEIPKVASLVLQGGFDLNLHAEISNPSGREKIRPFSGDLQDRLFSVRGEMTAKAELRLKFGFEVPPPVNFIGYNKAWPFAEATLFRFKTDSIPISGSLAETPPATANLFTYFTNERQLQLHVGDDAQFRNVSATEVNEDFVINHVQRFLFPVTNVFPPRFEIYDVFDITFSNVGITERYVGPYVDRVSVNMGSGNDTLKVIDAGSSVLYRLRGGGGDDVIDVDGNVDAQIFGDYSDSVVRGNEGNDVLDAGNGNNDPGTRRPTTINGGPGSDTISFGEGLLTNLKLGESYLVIRDPADTSKDRLTVNNSKSNQSTEYKFISSGTEPYFPEDSRFNYRLEMDQARGINFFDPLPRIWMTKYDAVTIQSGTGDDAFRGVPQPFSVLYGGGGVDTFYLDGSNAPGLPVSGFTGLSFSIPSFTFYGGSGDDKVAINDTGSLASRSYRAAVYPTREASASIRWSESATSSFELKLSGVEDTGLTVKPSDTIKVYGWDENLLTLSAGEVKVAADNSAVWDSYVFLSDTPKLTFFDGDSIRGSSSGGIDYIGPYFKLANGNRFRVEFNSETTNFGFDLDRVVIDISPELLRKQWNLKFAPADRGRIDLISVSDSYDFQVEANQIVIGTWSLPYASGGIDDIRIIGGLGDDHLLVRGDLKGVDVSFDGGPGGNDTVEIDRSSAATLFGINQKNADTYASILAFGAWGVFNVYTERTDFLNLIAGVSDEIFIFGGEIKQPMAINAGGGNDTFTIGQENFPVNFAAPIRMDGGEGNDTFTWYGVNNSLDQVIYAVDIIGGGGRNTLLVDDKRRIASPSTYDIYQDRIKVSQSGSNAGANFNYDDMSSVTLTASDNNDTFNVQGISSDIAANDRFKIFGAGGSDTINIELLDFEGTRTLGQRLSISGGAGSDRVIVDQSNREIGLNYQIYNQSSPGPTIVNCFYDFPIGFFDVDDDTEQLQLDGGTGNDSFVIFSYQNFGTALSINGGQGDDNLAIVPVTGSIFSNVSRYSKFSFDGGAGKDSFSFNNITGAEPTLYQRDGSQLLAFPINGDFALNMSVTQYENMSVTGGSNGDLFFVDALSSNESINLNGGGGMNTFYVGQRNRNTQTIRGQIVVDGGLGGGSLIVDNSSNTTGTKVHIDSEIDGTLGSDPSDTLFGPGGSLQFKNLKNDPSTEVGIKLTLGSGVDTVYAAPQLNTTLSIAGGAPNTGTGDNLFLALAGVQNPNTVSLGAGDGKLTSSNRKDVTWTSFENLNTNYVAPKILKVTNTLDSGPGSLRQAILDANATLNAGGPDVIRFEITSASASIRPLSQLPNITDPVVIDGTSQPGYAGKPVVELDGSSAGRSNGLVILSGGTTVRGLAINRFGLGELSNIVLQGAGGNVIQGNYIGTNLAGNAAYTPSPTVWGIVISDSDNNIIGTNGDGVNDSVEGNVISGHGGAGVLFDFVTPEQSPDNNVVGGNRIGTSADGNTALGNGRMGVFMLGSGSGNRIGTNADGISDILERNLISGNAEAGIFLGGNGVIVAGNYIGTNEAGTAGLPNGNGIRIERADNNRVGGSASGAGNRIAFNSNVGVSIGAFSGGNSILGNSIFENGEIGIDLNGPGETSNRVTPNDAADADAGPNKLQNYPSLSAAQSNNGQTLIGGTLQSTPQTTFRIEFFSSGSADPTGFGEGQAYLGFVTTTTDASGYASFVASFPQNVLPGQFISSTATDPQGNTSEFSKNVTVVTSLGANVATLRSPVTNSLYLVASPAGTSLTATARATPDVAPPSNLAFPYGFLDFKINGLTPGASADVTITGLDSSFVTDYFKYGATLLIRLPIGTTFFLAGPLTVIAQLAPAWRSSTEISSCIWWTASVVTTISWRMVPSSILGALYGIAHQLPAMILRRRLRTSRLQSVY